MKNAWMVHRIRHSLTHPWLATAPGCPLDRHPTRWCGCRVFRTEAGALDYAKAQAAEPGGSDRG